MEGPNRRIDQFIRDRLQQIDISLSQEERRAAEQLVPYLRWSTDDELLQLYGLLQLQAGGQITGDELARAQALCERIAGRLVRGGATHSVIDPDGKITARVGNVTEVPKDHREIE